MPLYEKIKIAGTEEFRKNKEREEKEIIINLENLDQKIINLSSMLEKLKDSYEKVGVSGNAFKSNYKKLEELFQEKDVKSYLAERGIKLPKDLIEKGGEEISTDPDVVEYDKAKKLFKENIRAKKNLQEEISKEFGIDFKGLKQANSKKQTAKGKTFLQQRVEMRFQDYEDLVQEVLKKMKDERRKLYEQTTKGREEKENQAREEIKKELANQNLDFSRVYKNQGQFPDIISEKIFKIAKGFQEGGTEFVKKEVRKEMYSLCENELLPKKNQAEGCRKKLENLEELPFTRDGAIKALRDADSKKKDIIFRISKKISDRLYNNYEDIREKISKIISNAGFNVLNDYTFYRSRDVGAGEDPIQRAERCLEIEEENARQNKEFFIKEMGRENDFEQIKNLEDILRKEIERKSQRGEFNQFNFTFNQLNIPDYNKAIEFAEKYSNWLDELEKYIEELIKEKQLTGIKGVEAIDEILYDSANKKINKWKKEWGINSDRDIFYNNIPKIILQQNEWLILHKALIKEKNGPGNFSSLLEEGKEINNQKLEDLNKSEGLLKELISCKIDLDFTQRELEDYRKENPLIDNIVEKQKILNQQKNQAEDILRNLNLLTQGKVLEPNDQIRFFKELENSRGVNFEFVELMNLLKENNLQAQEIQKNFNQSKRAKLENEKRKLEKKKTPLRIGKRKKEQGLQDLNLKLEEYRKTEEALNKTFEEWKRLDRDFKLKSDELEGFLQKIFSIVEPSYFLENKKENSISLKQFVNLVENRCKEIKQESLDSKEKKALDNLNTLLKELDSSKQKMKNLEKEIENIEKRYD